MTLMEERKPYLYAETIGEALIGCNAYKKSVGEDLRGFLLDEKDTVAVIQNMEVMGIQ